jgi:hypothetical protein
MRAAPLVAVGSLFVATATLGAAYWTTEVVVSGGPGGFGYYNATAVQHGTGHLFIAYSDNDRDDVLLRRWNGSGWLVQTVDAGKNVARGVDLAFTAGNQPAVSYAGGAVKYAEWTGSAWAIATVESKNALNEVTSLEFSQGQPAISYFQAGSRGGPASLKLARRNGSKWSSTAIATGARYSSLAFDGSGVAAIAFAGDSNGDGFADSLKLARQTGSAWAVETIDTTGGAWARLGYDPALGFVVVDAVSSTGSVRFWQKSGGTWQSEHVGSGFRPALLVRQGAAMVSYVTSDGYGLVLAKRDGGTWSDQIVAGAPFGYIGQASLAVPYYTNGEPAIAYCIDIFGINASRTLWLARPPAY